MHAGLARAGNETRIRGSPCLVTARQWCRVQRTLTTWSMQKCDGGCQDCNTKTWATQCKCQLCRPGSIQHQY
eukprot:10836798-Lingulodinium_polyedra.AAC.1